MLVFKPWWMFEKEREYKERRAETSDRSKRVESKDGQERDGMQFVAGKRKGTDSQPLRQEVKGSDIQYKGEAEVDVERGRSFPEATDADLTVE